MRKPENNFTLNENKNKTNQIPRVIDSKSQTKYMSKLPKRSENLAHLADFIQKSEKQKAWNGRVKVCTFCKSNGESEQIYSSHSLKDANDKITCPVLLEYQCPFCGAKGEKSHTKKYCPVLQKKLRLEMLEKISKNDKEN